MAKKFTKKRARKIAYKTKRRFTKKARLSVPRNVVSTGTGFPKKLIMNHKYTETVNVNNTTGLFNTYVMSCNGLFDPNITGTGRQPLYFDQLTALYNHYVVIGSKCTFKFTPAAVTSQCLRVACFIEDGASVTPTALTTYLLDRWRADITAASKFSVQQSSVAPAGFKNSILITSLAATSVGASEFYQIGQGIEGFNLADLDWGTANAKTVTLSFWVRSSLTGTFGGNLITGSGDQSYPFSYTISSANTWEQKTLIVAGPTAGTYSSTNSVGVNINFSLGAGSSVSGTAGSWSGSVFRSSTGASQLVGTNGATFYITGVQLEVGTAATNFDVRSYGTELQLCYRYFYSANITGVTCVGASSTLANGTVVFPVRMRATPTCTGTTVDRMTNFGILDYAGSYTYSTQNSASTAQCSIAYTQASGSTWSTGVPLAVNPLSQNATFTASAEL